MTIKRHAGWAARLLRVCLLGLLSMLYGNSAAAEPIDIAVVTGDSPRHTMVVEAVGAQLKKICGQPCRQPATLTNVDTEATGEYLARTKPDVVVTIGAKAARKVAELQIDVPTLYGFIPSNTWRELEDCCVLKKPTNGRVLLDQPADRLLNLIRALHPDAERIGVLLGPATKARLENLNDAAKAVSIDLQSEQVKAGDDVGRKLRQLVARVDVLLALPDPAVYNRSTVYPILLTTYSARIPVIGFSSAMVKAGATAGLFVTPRDGGEAIAVTIDAYRITGAFAVDEETLPYSIEVNEDVLRSLKLPATTANDLLENIKERTQ